LLNYITFFNQNYWGGGGYEGFLMYFSTTSFLADDTSCWGALQLCVYSCIYLTSWSCIVTCLVGMVTSTLLSHDTVLVDCFQAYEIGWTSPVRA